MADAQYSGLLLLPQLEEEGFHINFEEPEQPEQPEKEQMCVTPLKSINEQLAEEYAKLEEMVKALERKLEKARVMLHSNSKEGHNN